MSSPIAIVTGASRGIGKAICSQLLEEGYHVVGIARHFQMVEKHPNFEAISLDLSDLERLPDALKTLKERYPRVTTVICNAGRGEFKHLEEFSFHQIRSLIDLNFLSHVYMVKAFLPLLKMQERSAVIFIGSEASLAGKRQGSIYCASKFAIRGFAQALRDECAASSVRVCLINPGMVQTDFFHDLSFMPGEKSYEHLISEDIAEAVKMVLYAREGTVFDEINLTPHKKRICFKKNQR